MHTAAQGCREDGVAAPTLFWISKSDSEWCCGLQWERSDLLVWHCPLQGSALSASTWVTGRRAHSCFHEIKTFSDTCTLPLQKNTARGIRRDQGRLKQEVIFLAKEGNSLPHFCILWHLYVVTMLQEGGTSLMSWAMAASFSLSASRYARRRPFTVLDHVCFADWRLPL